MIWNTFIVVLFGSIVVCESDCYDDDAYLTIRAAGGQIEANMNEYMDLTMTDTSLWMVNNGLDPMNLPDITKEFMYKPVLVTYHGELHLTNGILLNLRNISRNGDSTMYYGYKLMRIRTGISMSHLNFRYDYNAKIMNLGPIGWIDGCATNIDMHADFIVDLVDYYIYIQEFSVTSIGSINVKVRGNALTDWMGNIIIKLVTTLYKSTLVNYISARVYDMAKITTDGINNRMSIYDRREVAAKYLNDIEIQI